MWQDLLSRLSNETATLKRCHAGSALISAILFFFLIVWAALIS
jgi:hypothetical protein